MRLIPRSRQTYTLTAEEHTELMVVPMPSDLPKLTRLWTDIALRTRCEVESILWDGKSLTFTGLPPAFDGGNSLRRMRECLASSRKKEGV